MKISEAKKLYSAQLDQLRSRKQALTKILKEDAGGLLPQYDRVELSKELSQVEKEYGQTQGVMGQLQERETAAPEIEVQA